MKLYGSYTSPYVRHCRIVIEQLGLDCQLVETDHAKSAEQSPNMKVPFLQDGDLHLTDSTSILLHFYTKSGKPFIQSAKDMDLYAMTNTLMDACINLFLLGVDGVTPETSPYLNRHASRVRKGLDALENSNTLHVDENNIAATRLVCFLTWGVFRNLISLEERPKLEAFMNEMNVYPAFKNTLPPSE